MLQSHAKLTKRNLKQEACKFCTIFMNKRKNECLLCAFLRENEVHPTKRKKKKKKKIKVLERKLLYTHILITYRFGDLFLEFISESLFLVDIDAHTFAQDQLHGSWVT